MGYIIKPLISEKMNNETEKRGTYGFIVRPEANKLQIKAEIEKKFNVKVVAVNTCIYAGKNKSRYTRSGLIKGRTNAFKKAVVKLADGESIDFYSNI